MPAFIGERNLAAKMALTTTTKTTATTYSYALTFFFYFSFSSSSSSCLLTLALAMSGRPSIEERTRKSCRRATKPKIDRINSKSIILLPGCYCDAPAPLSVGQFLACLLAFLFGSRIVKSLSLSLCLFFCFAFSFFQVCM